MSRLLLLDLAAGQETVLLDEVWPPFVAWSPDGRHLLVEGGGAALAGAYLHRYDLQTGTLEPLEPPGLRDYHGCAGLLHVSPDARRLAYAGPDGALRFRDLATGRERDLGVPPPTAPPPLPSWFGLCHEVAWSPDGRWFAWHRWRPDLDPFPREAFVLHRDAAGVSEAVSLGVTPGWGGFGLSPSTWWRPLLWSPDGRWLDLWTGILPPLPAPGTDPAPPPGGWPGRISCPLADEACRLRRPGGAYRWSPDAAWVVYHSFGPPPEVSAEAFSDYWTVRLARLDGRVDVPLAVFATHVGALPSPYRALYGAYTYHTGPFSPDRRFVYYVTPEGELWSYELATGRRFYLEALNGAGYAPDVAVIPVPVWRPFPAG